MNDAQINLMHNEKIPKALLKLGIPTMIGMLISAFYNVIDAYFVSGLGTSAMGAVSVSFPIGQIIFALGSIFGSGAASYISRLLGNKEYDRANKTASTALISSVVVGIVMIFIAIFNIDSLLIAFGATPTILPYAKEYSMIFIGGSIFHIFTITVSNIITAGGVTQFSMISMAVGGILNVILDPLMIYTFGWGIRGAAIATIVSQMVSFGMYLWFILSKKSVIRFSLKNFAFDRAIFSEIFKVGIPIFIFQFLASMALAFTNMAVNSYGDAAVASVGIVTRVLAIGSYVVYGFLRGFQPLAGYNYGAKLYKRLQEAIQTSLLWTTAFSVISALLLIIFAPNVISIFSSDPDVLEIGSKMLRIHAVGFMVYGFEMVYAILFLALGRIKEGGLFTISRQGIFFIPLIFLLPRVIGLNGVMLAQPIADALTTLLCIYFAFKIKRELKGLEYEEQHPVIENNVMKKKEA